AEQKKQVEELQKEADTRLAKILTEGQNKQLKEMREGFGGEVKEWDAQTGQELLSIKGAGWPRAFIPEGKSLFFVGKVWDAQTGRELLTLKGVGGIGRTLSPDGKRLAGPGGPFGPGSAASGGPPGSRPGEVKVWDAQTGQELLSLKGHT